MAIQASKTLSDSALAVLETALRFRSEAPGFRVSPLRMLGPRVPLRH